MTVLDASVVGRDGALVVVARRASVPLVQVRALLPGRAGPTSRLAAACLLRGVGTRERLDDLGVSAEVAARPDGLLLSACAEPGGPQTLLDLIQELVHPRAAPPAEVLSAEVARLTQLDVAALQDPGESTRRAALRLAFGAASPYAESAKGLSDVTPEDVQAWHESRRDPAVVVVCGDVDPCDDWGGPAELAPQSAPAPMHSAPTPPRWQVRDRPGSAQTTLRGIAPFPRPGAADRPAALVMERLLGGGGKGSRLVRELRERRGFGYHPGTSVLDLAGTSSLLLEADVATAVTAEAVAVVDQVLGSLVLAPPEEGELEIGRRGVLGDLARATDAQGSLADLLLGLALAGCGPDELPLLRKAVTAVTSGEVAELAADLARDLHGAASADLAALEDQQLPETWG